MKPREFWIQINQHELDENNYELESWIYHPRHVEITQDYKLDWHKSMCTLVREVTGPDYKSIAEELMRAWEKLVVWQDDGVIEIAEAAIEAALRKGWGNEKRSKK